MGYQDFLVRQGLMKAAQAKAQQQANLARHAAAFPGGASQAQALAQPNVPDPQRIADPAAGNWDARYQAAQAAAARAVLQRLMGGGTPQSAMTYPQLVGRGPAYGSQAARVHGTGVPLPPPVFNVNAEMARRVDEVERSLVQPTERPAVPQWQDIRRFEGNTQLPSGVPQVDMIPPAPEEMAAAEEAYARAFAALQANPSDPATIKAYEDATKVIQDLRYRERGGPSYFSDKGVLDLIDADRDLIVTEMGANAYDVATGKKDDWGAEWAAVAPGNWMVPGIDQTRFTQDFEAWVEDPANWPAIRYASEHGFQADEFSPRYTGGRAVWELFINGAGRSYKALADIMLSPTVLLPAGQASGEALQRSGQAAMKADRPMAATIYDATGRGLSLPQDVLDATVDAPFNAVGAGIRRGVGIINDALRPGKASPLDHSAYDRGVDFANTGDRMLQAYDAGARPLRDEPGPMPPAAGPATPPDGGPPPGTPRYTLAVEDGQNVIRDPQGDVVERLPYEPQTGPEPPRVNRDAQRTLDQYNFDIDTQEYLDAGAVLPDRNLGWADPRYNATTNQGRNRPMTITQKAAFDGTIPAEQRQGFWDEATPKIEEHVRVMDDIRAMEEAADYGKGVSYERDLVQGQAPRHTPEKAFEEVRHVAEDLIPAWRNTIAAEPPPYRPRYTDRESAASLIERAVFGTREEGIAARKRLYQLGTRFGEFKDTKQLVRRLEELAVKVHGEGYLSDNPAAVKSRRIREQQAAQTIPDPAAVQEVAPAPPVAQTAPDDISWSHIMSTGSRGLETVVPARTPWGFALVRNPDTKRFRIVFVQDNGPLAVMEELPVGTNKRQAVALFEQYDAATRARLGVGPNDNLPNIPQRQAKAPAAPTTPLEYAPALATRTPKGGLKKETRQWSYRGDVDDRTTERALFDSNARWTTTTGNRITTGQARALYIEPAGPGTKGLAERIEIRPRPRRNEPDAWELRYPKSGKRIGTMESLQDALAWADELALELKAGWTQVPPKQAKQAAEAVREAREIDPEATLAGLRQPQRYGMEQRPIGEVPTFEREPPAPVAPPSRSGAVTVNKIGDRTWEVRRDGLPDGTAAYVTESSFASGGFDVDLIQASPSGATRGTSKHNIKTYDRAVQVAKDLLSAEAKRLGPDDGFRVGTPDTRTRTFANGRDVRTTVRVEGPNGRVEVTAAKTFTKEQSGGIRKTEPIWAVVDEKTGSTGIAGYTPSVRTVVESNLTFKDAVERAKAFLRERQQPSGIKLRNPLENLDNPGLRERYGMVEGPGDTARISQGDTTHVGAAHRIGGITAEEYRYLTQPVTYNDRPMRLWEAYEAALHDFRDDATKARAAVIDALMPEDIKTALADRRMTPEQRKAARQEMSTTKRAATAALAGYDTAGKTLKQNLMFNWARGVPGILADNIERTYSQALNREYRSAANNALSLVPFTPQWKTFRRFMADERGRQAAFEAMDDYQLYVATTGRAPRKDVMQLVETRFDVGSEKDLVLEEALGRGYTWTPLRAFADPYIRDFRVAGDRTARWMLNAAVYKRNLRDASIRMGGLIRTRAERAGLDADAVVRAFDEMPPGTGGDVTRVMKEAGLPDGVAERLGRDWAELVRKADVDADQRVKKLLFSYKMTGADNVARRFLFFHYWMSRALVLHSRTTLQNPWLISAYGRAWEAMEREAEQNGYPPSLVGFVRLMQSDYGTLTLVSPLNVLVPFGMLVEQHGDDPGVLNWLRRWGLFVNPLIEYAAAAMGWHNRAPDITGTRATRRGWRVTLNWLNSNGYEGIVPDFLGSEDQWRTSWFDWFQGWVAQKANEGLRYVTGGDMSPLGEFDAGERGAYEYDVLRTILMDVMEADLGPSAGWTEEQWDDYEIAWTGVVSGSSNEYAQQAVEIYSDDSWAGVGLRAIVPGGIMQESMPRAEDRRLAEEGYAALDAGEQPTPEQRAAMDTRQAATAGSREDLKLDRLQDGYANIGTPRQREIADAWTQIVRKIEDVPPGHQLVVGGRVWFAHDLAQLTEEQRETLADRWLAEHGLTDEHAAYKQERRAYVEQHPEFGAFKDWESLAYDYEGGLRTFRADRAMSNPNFKRAMEAKERSLRDQGTDPALIPDELDAWARTLAAYKAANGIKDSVYADDPISTGDQGTVNTLVQAMDTKGGGSGKTVPKTTAEKIKLDLAEYEKEAAVFAAILQNAGITADPATINNPLMQRALGAQFGDLMPKQSKLLRTYLAWRDSMPPGTDTSPEAFARVMDQVNADEAA